MKNKGGSLQNHENYTLKIPKDEIIIITNEDFNNYIKRLKDKCKNLNINEDQIIKLKEICIIIHYFLTSKKYKELKEYIHFWNL